MEKNLFSVEEIDHHVNICTIVTMGEVIFESPVIITTIGVSALGENEGSYKQTNNQFLFKNTAPEDYTDIDQEVLTFRPGDTKKCVRVTIIEDDIVEGDETFTIVIQSSLVRIGTPDRAEVTINDNSRKYYSVAYSQTIKAS